MVELSFGEWLKRQRSGRGLTQEQLAQQIGCATITLRKIESEERRPSAQIVERLAEIFKIPQKEQPAFLRFARGDWESAPAIESDNAPWRASATFPRSRLPSRLTELIGREQDVAQVREYLAQSSTRLVTLTGPPGIGKTSLSQQVAADSMGDFSEGVFFVALAPLTDASLVASTIGQTLRFEGRGNISELELLKDGISDKQMLLVLDNFEHLLGAAPIVPELLTACPNLKILVTSREALRVPGEWIYSIPPLVVPQVSQSKEMDLTTAHDFSALTLFAERARAVHSDFNLNPKNAGTVAAICARLDGLPLAIELIAARVRLMSPQELLFRMEDQFTLFADGMRAMPARQKTLHNAIAWSYDLLTPEEQKLLAYLGVFAGGFTLEAVSDVTGNPDVLTGITALLDKSLLQRTIDEQGETRFIMLFTIREFALNRLDEINETAKLRGQHLKYFLDLAEQADKEIHGPHQVEWLDCLEAEHDNYRAALDWCISSGQTESALHLIGSFSGLGRFWSVRSYFSEARSWFNGVCASVDVSLYPIAYTSALNGMSFIGFLQSDFGFARTLAEESQRICEGLGTEGELGLAGALLANGLSTLTLGDSDVAHMEACYQQAVAIYQAHDHRWELALALFRLGVTARLCRNYARSRLFLEDSLGIFLELDDAFGLGRVYRELGSLFYMQGDYKQARTMFELGLYYDKKLHFQHAVSSSFYGLGNVCRIQGEYDQSEDLFFESLRISREYNLGEDNIIPFYLGCILLHRGNYTEARARLIEFTKINHKLGDFGQIGDGLAGLAAVATGVRQYERSARLASAGQAIHNAVGFKGLAEDRIEIDPLLQIAREKLGEERFELLSAEGRAMTMEQAVAYALEEY
ncbi:MAG: helix-turn-helix domain-containing protein [Anaerolineales bacterium]